MKKLILSALLILAYVSSALAKDFKLERLRQAEKPMYDLSDFKGKTYYDVVHDEIAQAMEKEGKDRSGNNERKLKRGKGVSVKLTENNYNIHINFPASAMGGRSYGWTSGGVGDWSDSMYLESLGGVVLEDDAEIKKFYQVVIRLLAASDATGLEELKYNSQRVATNFLAIYTAEQYRRIQDRNTRWDDALLQATLLGAFHGGQEVFETYYAGVFTDTSKEKGPGVYNRGKPGVLSSDADLKSADIMDYHQFSAKRPEEKGSNRSGINLTRGDFEKMGEMITRAMVDSRHLEEIKEILGIKRSKNIIADIAESFALGKIESSSSHQLSNAVANFMVEVKDNANMISNRLRGRKKSIETHIRIPQRQKACLKSFKL